MKIWKQEFSLDGLNQMHDKTIVQHIGIEFINFGDDFLEATMPVDDRTVQPVRILHGGASVVLAETLGSLASTLCLEDIISKVPVGLEVNANHLRKARSGMVTGRCTPVKIGRSMHVWNIEIRDESGKLTCVSRLTTSIVSVR